MKCRSLNRLAPTARIAFLQGGESQRAGWDLSRKLEYHLWLLLASVDDCQIKHTSNVIQRPHIPVELSHIHIPLRDILE